MTVARDGPLSVASALDTLILLRSRGARLWVENDRLRYTAPKGVLSSEDLDRLRSFRDDLIVLIGGDASDNAVALTRRCPADPVPLTPIQHLTWQSVDRKDQPHVRRHVCAVSVHGNLLVDVLAKALQSLRSRHEVLRTRFLPTVDGGLVQHADAVGPCQLAIIDIAGREPEVRSRALDELLKATVRLSEGPLFDARLIKLAHEEYLFAASLDEMISDCKSNEIVMREIWTEYVRLARGEEPLMASDPIQVADYAVWLQNSQSAWMGAHASYWRQRLQDASGVAEPCGRRTGRAAVAANRRVAIDLDTETVAQLASFARERQIFPAVVVLAVCVASIFRCYAREDMVVVVVDHGRYRPELHNMIGWLVNNLYLRVAVSAEKTFEDLVWTLGRELENAHHHRDFNRVPLLLPEVVADLHFNWRTGLKTTVLPSDGASGDPDIQLHAVPLPSEPSRSECAITFDHDRGVTGTLEYRVDSWLASAVDRFTSTLKSLLKVFIQHPTQTVGCGR